MFSYKPLAAKSSAVQDRPGLLFPSLSVLTCRSSPGGLKELQVPLEEPELHLLLQMVPLPSRSCHQSCDLSFSLFPWRPAASRLTMRMEPLHPGSLSAAWRAVVLRARRRPDRSLPDEGLSSGL